MFFLYFSQLHLLIVPIGTIIADIIAVNSYGTRLQALYSWTGNISALSTALDATTAAQITTRTGYMALASVDKRFLLFKSVVSTPVTAGDYSLIAAMLQNAYDFNYTTTMYLVTFFGFCDLFVSWFSYFQFGYAYVYARDDAAAAAALAATFD